MSNGTTLRQHPNAPLTPEGRRRMVRCVIDDGWTVEAAADRFQIDAKTVRKWRDRYLAEGEAGLVDRSSRSHRSPNRTRRQLRRKVSRIRKKRRWGADHIAHVVGLAASTVQNILNQAGLGRLDRGDRATDTVTVRRYQRDTPGELIHVDIKKIAEIPGGLSDALCRWCGLTQWPRWLEFGGRGRTMRWIQRTGMGRLRRRRRRLNRGGNRQANAALYRVVIVRMRWHPPTIAYVQRRTAEGLTKKDIIRCLKRYVAREIHQLLPEPAIQSKTDRLPEAV